MGSSQPRILHQGTPWPDCVFVFPFRGERSVCLLQFHLSSAVNYNGIIAASTSKGNYSGDIYNDPRDGTDHWVGIIINIDGSVSLSWVASDVTYNFTTCTFSSSDGQSYTAVNADGSAWAGPQPPTSPQMGGPPALWVNGTVYSYTYSFVDYPWMDDSTGSDLYSDGNGNTISCNTSDDSSFIQSTASLDFVYGTIVNNAYDPANGVYGLDVRVADSGGNPIYLDSGTPPALRVDGNSSLWHYIGCNAGLDYYAGDQVDQRIAIERYTATRFAYEGVMGALSPIGYFDGSVIVTLFGSTTVRAVALDGTPIAPTTYPYSWGPPFVWMHTNTWSRWSYAGSMNVYYEGAFRGFDTYFGDNDGQQLVIDSDGNVFVHNLASSATGTYLNPGAGVPRVFAVEGMSLLPGNETDVTQQTNPIAGPPSVWVNDIVYHFVVSQQDAATSVWVDFYSNDADGYIQIGADGSASCWDSNGQQWGGQYIPASNVPSEGGLFINDGYGSIDVRASSGTGPLPPLFTPQAGHPAVVKVNGSPYAYVGSTNGAGSADYYFGASPGQRLHIDSTNNVAVSIDITTLPFYGTGVLSGNVFVMNNATQDLRFCTANNLPHPPGTSPQWGPSAVWVEGVTWNYIGTVSDETLQIHADYYAGLNVGQVISISSSHQIGGAHSGTYNNGLIVSSGDLRALDSSGLFILSVGPPSQYRPSTLRFGAQQWHFLGTAGGNDYYATDEPGQRLTIAEDGSVTYYDRPNNIASASGTYNSSDSTITAQSGGIVYDVGTNKGDLDILGNILSLGSLTGNKNTAGVTIAFRDDTSVAESPSSSLSLTLTRPNATWLWSHGTGSSTTTQAMMSLDSAHRLNLYDPAVATANPDPVVRLDPNPAGKSKLGNVSITGSIRLQPAGDIDMGIYTAGPQP